MVMATSNVVYVQSETLCYVQNYFGKFPKSSLLQSLTSFYKEDEIGVAKCLLFEYVDAMLEKPDGVPRHKKRQGDNRKTADCDDLLQLFAALDAAKVSLPKFVAVDLTRVPSVAPGDVDIYTLAAGMENMKRQMNSVFTRLSAVESQACCEKAVFDVADWPTLSSKTAWSSSKTKTGQVPGVGMVVQPTVNRELRDEDTQLKGVGGVTSDESDWQFQRKKKNSSPPASSRQYVPIRIKGSRGDADRIKTVPRRKLLAAYVGRLHPDTTADDLHKYLMDEGLKGVVCKKLSNKDGKTFNTAAFYVTCCEESKDLFYSEQCWPEGVELRDWVYYN